MPETDHAQKQALSAKYTKYFIHLALKIDDNFTLAKAKKIFIILVNICKRKDSLKKENKGGKGNKEDRIHYPLYIA